MGKKSVAAVIGVTVAGVGALALLAGAKAKVTPIQIQVLSNPIPTILSVDGKEVATPNTLTLSKGTHVFKAVTLSPDTLTTYQFDKWTVNGVSMGYDNPEITLNLTGPATICAQFMLYAAGNYPAITMK